MQRSVVLALTFACACVASAAADVPSPEPAPAVEAAPSTPPPQSSPAPEPSGFAGREPCDNAGFLALQAARAAGDHEVTVCGNVAQVLPERTTASGRHKYFSLRSIRRAIRSRS